MARRSTSCRGCRTRDSEIARLRQQVKDLQSQIQSLRKKLCEVEQQRHRQAHPFRRDKTETNGKKPGRPKGHAPSNRPLPTPEQIDRVIDVPCGDCPDCQVPLLDPKTVVQYQTDLPPITPIVTQFNIETGFCPCCRQVQRGRHPEQLSDAIGAAGNTLGPNILTMAAELKHRLGVSYRKITDFFETYYDFRICPATFVQAEKRLTALAKPSYELLIDALRRAGVVHADETGWRIDRVNAWLWVFSSKNVTVYTIRTSRGADVPEDILGDHFSGTLVVDGLNTYTALDYSKGQCNGHLLRRCKTLRDVVPSYETDKIEQLMALVQEAIDLAGRREHLTASGYARRVQQIENRFDDWLDDNITRLHHPTSGCQMSDDLDRLDNHLRNHRCEWFRFLHEPDVPPTNNHAEQMLRPAVITRKVGGCNKTLLGALVHSVLSSLMVTCKRQGDKFLDFAKQLWQGGEPQAIPLAT
jgi:transposase